LPVPCFDGIRFAGIPSRDSQRLRLSAPSGLFLLARTMHKDAFRQESIHDAY
jgi:hypothetical protein